MNQELHDRAMEIFDAARLLELRGAAEAAREKYEEAAALEEECSATTGDDEPRSRGITSVAAVSLWMRAGKLDHAEALVHRYLSDPMGDFDRELLELLNEIRRQREELRSTPVEPPERTAALSDAMKKAEAGLSAGKVLLWKIKGAA